jgi:phage/plasmid-like protein (TIGR03299 family)
MSDNLTYNEKAQQYEMFVVGNRWHDKGQGKELTETISWEEACQLAHLDWEVEKQPLLDIRGKEVDAFGIFRTDNNVFLSTVGKVYKPIQNRKAFEFVDVLLRVENGSHYVSAGALGKGEQIWCQAKIPYEIDVLGLGDKHKENLLFTNAHNNQKSATAKLCDTRVVCANTLAMGLSEDGEMLTIRHNSQSDAKFEAAKKILLATKQQAITLKETFELLALRRMTKESTVTILERLFPKNEENEWSTRTENVIQEVLGIYEDNDKNAFPEIRGSAYNLLNAFTNFVDHKRTVKSTARHNGASLDSIRLESSLFGDGARFKETVFNTIIDLTQGNPIKQLIKDYSLPSLNS